MGRSEEKEPFTCNATCLRESDKAILCQLESGEEWWIPKSVVHDDSEVFDADDNKEGKLAVQAWWAQKEGLGL